MQLYTTSVYEHILVFTFALLFSLPLSRLWCRHFHLISIRESLSCAVETTYSYSVKTRIPSPPCLHLLLDRSKNRAEQSKTTISVRIQVLTFLHSLILILMSSPFPFLVTEQQTNLQGEEKEEYRRVHPETGVRKGAKNRIDSRVWRGKRKMSLDRVQIVVAYLNLFRTSQKYRLEDDEMRRGHGGTETTTICCTTYCMGIVDKQVVYPHLSIIFLFWSPSWKSLRIQSLILEDARWKGKVLMDVVHIEHEHAGLVLRSQQRHVSV